MDRALAQLRSHGAVVNDDDVARLSPLGTNHINVLGRYHVSLPDVIARGDFRPLRDTAEFDGEDMLSYAAAAEGSDGHFRSNDCRKPIPSLQRLTPYL